jgi:NAD(P)-dependent dehydrogenase (short-subunit alcohol dehydrogenase family)
LNLGLENCNVVVTGACGGIGQGIIKAFLDEGAYVFGTDLAGSLEAEAEWLKHVSADYQSKVYFHPCDISEEDSIKELVQKIQSTFEHIDVLINNAGINILMPAEEFSLEAWDKILAVNLRGAFFVSQNIMPLMLNRGGAIVNMASQHAFVGNMKRAAYCASKGGLLNLTRQLALEWAPYKIRVNALCPGFVIHRRNQEQLLQPAWQRQCLAQIPLRTYCKVSDLIPGLLYLSSPLSSMVTGQSLVIDGGYLAK